MVAQRRALPTSTPSSPPRPPDVPSLLSPKGSNLMAEGTIGGTPISELPPASFAYCEPGTEAVSTRCHFPIRDKSGKADAAHVRNALARLSGSPFEGKARGKVEA